MGARQGRVPFALHRKLVDLVAQGAARYPVDHGSPPRAELATLDIPERGLQLLLGVGPPATPGTHHGDTTDPRRRHGRRRHGRHRPAHAWFRPITGTETLPIPITISCRPPPRAPTDRIRPSSFALIFRPPIFLSLIIIRLRSRRV